jgi:methylated-DNA-[protein]-cysteine S-methyltransferase
MKFIYDTFATPCGDFSVALDETGTMVATAFGDLSALKKRFHPTELKRDASRTAPAREQILGYFAGERRSFDLPLGARGTPFQTEVWEALSRIPFGETRTYAEIAAEIGNPQACRAVGRANGSNPICLLIPCHRVIGADGSLTGFAFGEKIKRQLLEHEEAWRPAENFAAALA